jgi:serine/threonine protein phosphatase 1
MKANYKIYEKLVIPDTERLFIIGDAHGCYDIYRQGVKELGITEDDWVISVGDLIDRGKQNSKMLLEFISKPKRKAVIGNHESLAVEGLAERGYYDCWLGNGGDKTIKEVGEDGYHSLVKSILESMPIILEILYRGKTIGIIHGGVPPIFDRGFDKAPDWQEDVVKRATDNTSYTETLLWDRDALEANRYEKKRKIGRKNFLPSVVGIDYVFHGHTYVNDPEVYGNRYYIDTGSVFNGHLTFCWFDENMNVQYYTT